MTPSRWGGVRKKLYGRDIGELEDGLFWGRSGCCDNQWEVGKFCHFLLSLVVCIPTALPMQNRSRGRPPPPERDIKELGWQGAAENYVELCAVRLGDLHAPTTATPDDLPGPSPGLCSPASLWSCAQPLTPCPPSCHFERLLFGGHDHRECTFPPVFFLAEVRLQHSVFPPTPIPTVDWHR